MTPTEIVATFAVSLWVITWAFIFWDVRQNRKEVKEIKEKLRKFAYPEETIAESIEKEVSDSWK